MLSASSIYLLSIIGSIFDNNFLIKHLKVIFGKIEEIFVNYYFYFNKEIFNKIKSNPEIILQENKDFFNQNDFFLEEDEKNHFNKKSIFLAVKLVLKSLLIFVESFKDLLNPYLKNILIFVFNISEKDKELNENLRGIIKFKDKKILIFFLRIFRKFWEKF